MALKPCKECKQEVSTKAKSCPNCGTKKPAMSGKETAQGCLGLIVLSIIISALVGSCSDDDTDKNQKKPAKTSEETAAEKAACRQDLQCHGTKHIMTAIINCPPYIERLAKYDLEWTNGWTQQTFTHFSWKDKEKGIMTFFGDSLKLQNGFGAWQNYTYSCVIDTNNDQILDFGATAGQL